MKQDLQALESSIAQESQALGFWTFALGIFVSTLVSWLTAEELTPAAQATFVSVTLMSAVGSVWFGLIWLRERRIRPSLLKDIRGRAPVARVLRRIEPAQ